MSYQYFPTGASTAALMWNKFKRPLGHVCDPSAGKGHLFRHAKEGFTELTEEQLPWLAEIPDDQITDYRRSTLRFREMARTKFSHPKEISVVEIDIQHHANLNELGAKVLGYDFLEVQSLATVSQIIMNPPFADGVQHVLHAWDVVYDAEIVAIINAQSIKNPFSQDRQRLVALIEKYGTVEFLQSQFVDDVERKTDVEVALIYLEKVPSKYLDMDELLHGLSRGDNGAGEDLDPQVCSALALPSNFIQDTYHRFVQAVDAARKASEASAIARRLTDGIGITLEEMQTKGVGNDFREAANSIREAANTDFKERYDDLKKRAWGQILRSSLLTDKLSNQARRKIEASANSIYELEFSVGNVHGFLTGVIQSMGNIYQEMILDMFDSIIERSSDNVVFYKSWKSNQKHRMGVRIRKTRFIIPRFRTYFDGQLEYESRQFLADIDKVFGYLHGEKDAYDGLVNGFKNNDAKSGARISTRYFDFRFYWGTGTIHFYPKSEEVVEKINKFVGKLRNWIPGDMSEANADFQKQYDKGESMTKEYMEQYKKSARNSYGHGNPAYQLLQEIRGKKANFGELDRMEKAIEQVHESKGLHCAPALTCSPTVKALPLSKPATKGQEPEQLLLLAA
jgi:hypothetical protein